ncbi:islet cell autoantigen 1-like protein isoform X2 [Venturia canescens]|nr:islet cell autoantigen 1-like protein isoform X2 [Venturia canescens]
MSKMQHQYWVTKQTLSRKLGKKEDECIVASDAELDAKLELFRSIQESCAFLQRVIDKYQERLCNLAQEENAMGRFLKEAGKQDKTRAGKMMSAVGKSLSYSGQQRLALRAPLVRLYQEVETFRRRAIEDTLQNVQSMEKARTEYRAALSWMKNISQELDPDTSKQLERFRKVQIRVRRDKSTFDNQAFDCLQKVDLLAAARCNMFSHALVLYQSTLLNFTIKSAQAYATIANSFKGYQRYDFMIVKELAETSIRLAKETGDEDGAEDKDKSLFFGAEYHDAVEQAEEASTIDNDAERREGIDEKLVNIDTHLSDIASAESSQSNNKPNGNQSKLISNDGIGDFFDQMFVKENKASNDMQAQHLELEKSLVELDIAMDSFTENGAVFDFNKATSLATQNTQEQNQQSLQLLTSENVALLEDILNSGPNLDDGWGSISNDTFLPSGILKQSLGDAILGIGDVRTGPGAAEKKEHVGKGNDKSWLDLFAELDPLANNSIESLTKSGDSNAPA